MCLPNVYQGNFLGVILSYALIRPMGLSGVALATGLGWVLVVSFHSLMYWRTRNR